MAKEDQAQSASLPTFPHNVPVVRIRPCSATANSNPLRVSLLGSFWHHLVPKKIGRAGEIRTLDLLHPMQARYQATLQPEILTILLGLSFRGVRRGTARRVNPSGQRRKGKEKSKILHGALVLGSSFLVANVICWQIDPFRRNQLSTESKAAIHLFLACHSRLALLPATSIVLPFPLMPDASGGMRGQPNSTGNQLKH